MDSDLDELERRMAAAAAAMDFEAATRLRDQIRALRGEVAGGGDWSAGDGEVGRPGGSRLRRQEPGAMGLGTSDQKMVPPAGWKPPPRPDPMTAGHKKPRGGR